MSKNSSKSTFALAVFFPRKYDTDFFKLPSLIDGAIPVNE